MGCLQADTEKAENVRRAYLIQLQSFQKSKIQPMFHPMIKKKCTMITRRQGSEAEVFLVPFLRDGTDGDWVLISSLMLFICQLRWTLGDQQPWIRVFSHGSNDLIESQTPLKIKGKGLPKHFLPKIFEIKCFAFDFWPEWHKMGVGGGCTNSETEESKAFTMSLSCFVKNTSKLNNYTPFNLQRCSDYHKIKSKVEHSLLERSQ